MCDHVNLYLFACKDDLTKNKFERYLTDFTSLHQEAEELLVQGDSKPTFIVQKTMPLLKDFIAYQQLLLEEEDKSKLDLRPIMIHHLLVEAIEFKRNLFLSLQPPSYSTLRPLTLHKLWLRNISEHASMIHHQKKDRKSLMFIKKFDHLFLNVFDFEPFTPSLLGDPHYIEFISLIQETVTNFIYRLELLKDECRNEGSRGILRPFILEHMIDEASYYLNKVKVIEGL